MVMVVFLDGWVVAWERAEQRGVRLISECCARQVAFLVTRAQQSSLAKSGPAAAYHFPA